MTTETRKRNILQWCPTCDTLEEAHQELRFQDGLMVYDSSCCNHCGRSLWFWVHNPDAPLQAPKQSPFTYKAKQMDLF